MREQPDAANLLACAERSLRNELLPVLAPSQRQVALMIAKAMGIAQRQLALGEGPEQQELTEINQLLGGLGTQAATSVREANIQLAKWIRHGSFDQGQSRTDCHRLLREITRRRLAESDPKALSAAV